MRKRCIALVGLFMLLLSMVPVFADETVQAAATAIPAIQITDNDIPIWHMIEFSIVNAPMTADAWVGLFEYTPEADWYQNGWESAYKAKIMVANLGETPYFETLKSTEPKQYVIALFSQYGYDLMPVAVSEPITVQGMYKSKNMFTERAAYDAEMKQIYAEKRNGTYDIKSEMNKAVCNPNITADEIIHYIALKNSDTVFEYPKQSAYDADRQLIEIPASTNWYSYPKTAVEDTAVDPAELEGHYELLFDNEDFYLMQAGPSAHTSFTTDETVTLTYIETLQHNGTAFNINGTISLQDTSGKIYGPWPVFLGETFEEDNYFVMFACPNIVLPPGTYTIVNSEASTWLYNKYSGNAGMAYIEGVLPLTDAEKAASQTAATAAQAVPSSEQNSTAVQNSATADAIITLPITVRGHLYDASLQSLANKTISYAQNGQVLGSVTSDSSGTFTLTLQSGTYCFAYDSAALQSNQSLPSATSLATSSIASAPSSVSTSSAPASSVLSSPEEQPAKLQHITIGYSSPQYIYLLDEE